jgi:hypothetical protein
MLNPLRLSPERFRLWSSALIFIGAVQVVVAWRRGLSDWYPFAQAGLHAGTPLLLHPPEQIDTWAYPPGTAWLFVPFAHLPAPFDYGVYELLLLACAVAAGLVAARIFALQRATAVAMVLAWGPVTSGALVIGQTSPLGLLLAMLAILGLQRESVLLTAIPIGLLAYKPTYALPLIVVLVVRGRLRELAIVALMGVLWYAASAAAAGGDWLWPEAWLRALNLYQLRDFNENAVKALGIPTLFARLGIAPPVTVLVVAAAAVIAATLLRRVSALEAGCAACLVGLALSPHALGYDGALALPMLFFAATRLPEPYRTPLLALAYIFSPLTDLKLFPLDPVAVVVLGGALAWIVIRWPRRLAGASAAAAVPSAATERV